MGKTQINLVETKGFLVDLPFVGAPVTIRTESDEIVILMRLTVRPRDNVMDIDIDVSASGDGTTVSGLDEDSSSDFSRYWRATIHE